MVIRNGILSGTTLLFAMAGCPDTVNTGDANLFADAVADAAFDSVGETSADATPDLGVDAASDVAADTISPPDVAADTTVPPDTVADTVTVDAAVDAGTDSAVADTGVDAMGDATSADMWVADGVMSDGGAGDSVSPTDAAPTDTASDVSSDTASDVAFDTSGDGGACEEPTTDPMGLIGHPCDVPGQQTVCDDSVPPKALVWCDFGGFWQDGQSDCLSCTPVACDWDTGTCGVAIGYIGIQTAGRPRVATMRLRSV